MKTRFPSSTLLAVLAFSVLGAASSFAAGKPMIASKDLIVSPDPGAPISGLATVYSTGFEAGWVVGSAEPQNGFTATGVNLPWQSISTANPCEGAQHLRIIRDAAAGAGAQRVLLTPAIPQPAVSPSQVTMLIDISNDQGADYDVQGQSPSQNFLTWRVKFHYDDTFGGPGEIFVLDDLGSGAVFVGTGVPWVQGACAELKVQFDPANAETRYFYNGSLIYVSVIYAATNVEQVVWIHDNWQLGGETADFDALTWIDTPSDPVPAEKATWGRIKNQYR